MLTSDVVKIFTRDLANMFTDDLANMFTSELEKCEKNDLTNMFPWWSWLVNMFALYQEYDIWSKVLLKVSENWQENTSARV